MLATSTQSEIRLLAVVFCNGMYGLKATSLTLHDFLLKFTLRATVISTLRVAFKRDRREIKPPIGRRRSAKTSPLCRLRTLVLSRRKALVA